MSLILYARMEGEGEDAACVFWRAKSGAIDETTLRHTLEYLCRLSRHDDGVPFVDYKIYRFNGIPEIMEGELFMIKQKMFNPLQSMFFIIRGRVCTETLLALCKQINKLVIMDDEVVEQFPKLMEQCAKLPDVRAKLDARRNKMIKMVGEALIHVDKMTGDNLAGGAVCLNKSKSPCCVIS